MVSVASSVGVPAIAFGCFLLLMHHELDHVVLVHEFLALRQGSFGLLLIGVRPREFGLRGLLAALIADLALEIVEVAMKMFYSTLTRMSLCDWWLVGEFWSILGYRLSYFALRGGILSVGNHYRSCIMQNK